VRPYELAAKIKKIVEFFCSPTEKGAAGIAAPMGEELQQEGDKKEKYRKPLEDLLLFAIKLQLF
jgi:hypothetical protein